MSYYKAFEYDRGLHCRGYRYKVGKTHKFNGEIKMCASGFHCCRNILHCLLYYSYNDGNTRFCEVRVVGDYITKGDKTVTDALEVVREIKDAELEYLLTGVITDNMGGQRWYKGGVLHRDDDKPAYLGKTGTREWWVKGVRYRSGERPVIVSRDEMWWMRDGKLVRS